MYTCGIIEDEYLAQEILLKYIERHGNIKVSWSLDSIRDISSIATIERVDVLFLDLLDVPSNDFKTDNKLNKVSEGINEFAQHFSKVIITTAYPAEYVKSIGIHHSQVLMKPYTYSAFEQALASMM